MWHKFLIIPFLVTVAYGQLAPGTETALIGSEAPTQDASKIIVTAYQRYSALRRGREQEVVIVICRSKQNSQCPLNAATETDDPLPGSLELQPAEGFKIHYRWGDDKYDVLPGSGPAIDIGARSAFLVKIGANGKTPLGTYNLKGKLLYHSREETQPSPAQATEVVIPVIVVENHAKVSETGWSFKSLLAQARKEEEHHFKDFLTNALLVLYVPVYLVVCTVTDQCSP